VAFDASASRNADGTALSGDYLDGCGNQPLGAGFGRSANSAVQGQFSHAAFRHSQPGSGLSHCDVGDIVIGDFGLKLELNGTEFGECAHVVDQKADYIAVVVEAL